MFHIYAHYVCRILYPVTLCFPNDNYHRGCVVCGVLGNCNAVVQLSLFCRSLSNQSGSCSRINIAGKQNRIHVSAYLRGKTRNNVYFRASKLPISIYNRRKQKNNKRGEIENIIINFTFLYRFLSTTV